jgi:hypothetical protein
MNTSPISTLSVCTPTNSLYNLLECCDNSLDKDMQYEWLLDSDNENEDYKDEELKKLKIENTILKELLEQNHNHIFIYVAKLNHNKTEILTVYFDMEIAAQMNFVRLYEMNYIIENEKNLNNSYYILYNNCEYFLKNTFEKKYGKPYFKTNFLVNFKNKTLKINTQKSHGAFQYKKFIIKI